MAASEGATAKKRRLSIFSDPNPAINSLFGEILDWMLAPLLLMWPISIAATHHVAAQIADQAYDHMLAEQVVRLVRELRIGGEGLAAQLPAPAPLPTPDDGVDRQYYQVAVAGGDVIAGEPELPPLRGGDSMQLGVVHFRNANLAGEPVRIAYQLIAQPADARPWLVQVAETRRQRKALSSRIIAGVLLPQFLIIPLAVVLVWLGLTRGLKPLERLRERIRSRRPDDLSPLNMRTVPEELQPIIAAFNDMMQRLRDNVDAQQRFIAAAAHQLKTPLTGLKMQIELALQEEDPRLMREYLQRVAVGVARATRLTHQLLQLARAEASRERIAQRVDIDMVGLAREVTSGCVARALDKEIDLGFEAPARPLTVRGHPLLLREMIENLVDNAIKYTPAGGTVTVRLRAEAGNVVLEVEDTGIGIEPEERERIFDRFYRALDAQIEGSGLGLAIVREIAQLHGARVEALANPKGPGSVFVVHLPSSVVPPVQ